MICADIVKLDKIIRPKSFDVVIALDVIEHLDKKLGFYVIEAMERIARHRVILLVPNGYLPQSSKKVRLNPYMEHCSTWSVKDFLNLGYNIKGWSGLKCLAGPHGWLFHNLESLFYILMTVSQPFVEKNPQYAFHLFCWKDVKS